MGLGIFPFALHPLAYVGIAFGIIIGIALLLMILKVDHLFIWTFALLSGMYVSGSAWESLVVTLIPDTGHIYLFTIWWLTYGIAAFSFLIVYLVFQMQIPRKINWNKTISLLILIVGVVLFMGVLEDFGCFFIWGLEYFIPTEVTWHDWIGNVIPVFYLTAIPGLFLLVLGLYLGRKYREPTKFIK